MTEAQMLALLRKRYTEKAGNGDAWAFVPQVRNAAGFDASRTADAIAMALWPSRGLVLHGFEIKTSRSDWLRELKSPAKAEAFSSLVDYWWIAAADAKVVAAGELPDGWGLLVAKGGRLVCTVEARPLHDGVRAAGVKPLPESFDRSFLAALLRSSCRVSAATPAEVAEAAQLARESERQAQQAYVDALQRDVKQWEDAAAAFQEATGEAFSGWAFKHAERARAIGAAIRVVLDGEETLTHRARSLRDLGKRARAIAEACDREAGDLVTETA